MDENRNSNHSSIKGLANSLGRKYSGSQLARSMVDIHNCQKSLTKVKSNKFNFVGNSIFNNKEYSK